MYNQIVRLGRSVSDGLRGVGEIAILLWQCIKWLTRGLPYKRETIQQFYFIGVQSLPVILTTGAFTGAVLAYTSYNQFVTLGVESWTGAIVAKAQVWQLGPVLVGLMLAGRVGCSITAELGTMNVTEQVDALDTMGTDPVRYLVLPRVLASFFMTPVLTVFAMLIGIIAGLVMTVFILGAEWHFQWSQIEDWMVPYDYVQGLSKGLVFGVTISLICCRNGLKTTGGAEGVGKATTAANVSSCIAILILNLVMSILLFYLEPVWDTVAYAVDTAWLTLVGWVRALFGSGAL
ncbi:MAG: ABC transporter permease [Planctomycetes bacterium]|nr:ABC transporter permease [Planctomycetota bacterium]MCC8117038.1 ABC transporter permease [Planctomycetota bacterium]MCD7895381.1 ABC transporter permease [Planctomycetaceae bacterium]